MSSSKKSSRFRKPLSEKLLLDTLQGLGEFGPAQIRLRERGSQRTNNTVDAFAEIAWNGSQFVFALETGLLSSPKAIEAKVERAGQLARQFNVNPMILVPYLSEEQLRKLELRCVSGLDLCGNGVIIIPERLLVYRTGNPNKYPSSSPIRNVYRKASSLVGRVFLRRPKYESAQAVVDEIAARRANVTLSTVSKVCASMADDLIIERDRRGRRTSFRLLQPDKLLERLAANFTSPNVYDSFTGQLRLENAPFRQMLESWQEDTGQLIIRTGASSSDLYATMAREPVSRYYCTDVSGLVERLGENLVETNRFPNIQLLETEDPTVYFDPNNAIDASPVQSYLELAVGDKRDRETAQQIERRLLQELERYSTIP